MLLESENIASAPSDPKMIFSTPPPKVNTISPSPDRYVTPRYITSNRQIPFSRSIIKHVSIKDQLETTTLSDPKMTLNTTCSTFIIEIVLATRISCSRYRKSKYAKCVRKRNYTKVIWVALSWPCRLKNILYSLEFIMITTKRKEKCTRSR